ncbi:Transmembrane protein [Quillaja saponaria]|uniref:Transmembrane protein n=1 Tax=Quillaja saponaria TaxID=32244 RepID=A0AAD7LCM6_QUISA|nr:Transmembrane protein [Quillaja saponaria]
MDHLTPRNRDSEVDLESGLVVNEGNCSQVSGPGSRTQSKSFLAKVCGGFDAGSVKREDSITLCSNESKLCGVSTVNAEVVTNKLLEGERPVGRKENTPVKEKRKKTSNKKPSKPPRPPRGPSLDAADQKLIREISELATMKRARVERMKALKKMKAAKTSSSSSSNIFALVFTILFCLVIIFQGMSSGKSSIASFQGSPVSAGESDAGLISVHYYLNPSASDPNALGSESPNFVQQVAGSDPLKS